MIAAGFTAAAVDGILADLEASEAPSPADPGSIRSVTGTGGELWIEQLLASGVEYVFSNPGSMEVAFFDALTDTPGLQLIVGLHEGLAIAMADGYHKATGKTAFVNVHAMVGTAQATGQQPPRGSRASRTEGTRKAGTGPGPSGRWYAVSSIDPPNGQSR